MHKNARIGSVLARVFVAHADEWIDLKTSSTDGEMEASSMWGNGWC